MVWRGRAQWKDQEPSKENKVKGLEAMSEGWNTCATSGWIDPHNAYPAALFVFVKIINSLIFFIIIITDGTEISVNCSSELLKEGYRSHCSPLSVTHRPHHYSCPVNDLLSQDAACLRSCPQKRLGSAQTQALPGRRGRNGPKVKSKSHYLADHAGPGNHHLSLPLFPAETVEQNLLWTAGGIITVI